MSLSLNDLTSYLDAYLKVAEVPDEAGALNGLQVQNGGTVTKVLAAVDACQASIDRAVEEEADLLVVHHGLFWGGPQPIVGRQWRRLVPLIREDVAVYSAHIPLDCHPEVGNNAVLARELGLRDTEPFGDYRGTLIGVAGRLDATRADLVERLGAILGASPQVIDGGPARVSRVGVITGGGGSMIGSAVRAGIDTFVTGEGAHHTYFDAVEGGINVIYGGHYATETFGVRALAAHIQDRFGLPWTFFDHPTGL